MSHPGITYLDEPRRCCRLNILGIFGCLVSILGIFTAGLLSPFGLVLSLIGMTRGPRGAATAGTLLGALGTGFLVLCGWGVVATIDAVHYEEQAAQTQAVMQQGVDAITQFQYENKQLPEGIHGNKLLIAAELNDAWGQSLRYEPIDDQAYNIRSAGPDEKFETADDLTLH